MPGLQWSIAREPGSDSRRQFIRAPGAPVSRTRTRIVRYCNYSRVAADGRQRLDHYTGEVDQCDSSAAGKRTGNVSHRCETVARSIQISGLAFFPGTRCRLADRVNKRHGRMPQVGCPRFVPVLWALTWELCAGNQLVTLLTSRPHPRIRLPQRDGQTCPDQCSRPTQSQRSSPCPRGQIARPRQRMQPHLQ